MISIPMDANRSMKQFEATGSLLPGNKCNRGGGTNDFANYLKTKNPLLLANHCFDVIFGDMQTLPERKLSHIIRHEYIDHLGDDDEHYRCAKRKGHGAKVPFPARLHQMLDEIENDGHADVISWQPHGRCFVVHKQKEFREVIMPKYFKMSKFPSFLRQVNLYGFRRLTRKGPDKGGYYHELFLRNKKDLASAIPRLRIKGNGVRTKSNPACEPDFYKMPTAPAVTAVPKTIEPSIATSAPSFPMLEQIDAPYMYDDGDTDVEDCNFAGRTFHCVADVKMIEVPGLCKGTLNNDEMDTFLRRLNISTTTYDDITSNLETDFDFGTMMTRLMDMEAYR
jgi:HSF-type DNA-binding